MKCHMCGQRESTVHLLELIDGQQKGVWLCSICASGRSDISVVDPGERTAGEPGGPAGELPSLAAFLGQIGDVDGALERVGACPVCRYQFKQFQDSNRFGCSQCYPHFRAQVAPILARYHRHATHLGKVPLQAGGMASKQGEITRIRVALEKAIQSEDYEEAATLRDTMRRMVGERDQLKDAGDPGQES